MKTDWQKFFYFLWWLISGLDGVGALLAALRLRELGRAKSASPQIRRVSTGYFLLLISLSIEAFITTSVLYFLQEMKDFPLVYISFRLVGRTIKAVGIWVFVFYVLGLSNGGGGGTGSGGRRKGEDRRIEATESGASLGVINAGSLGTPSRRVARGLRGV